MAATAAARAHCCMLRIVCAVYLAAYMQLYLSRACTSTALESCSGYDLPIMRLESEQMI